MERQESRCIQLLYFIKYKPVNNLTHAGTGKTVMTTFDNRNLLDSIMKNELINYLVISFTTRLMKG